MVLSGTEETKFCNDFYFGYSWSASQNVAKNTSTVTVTSYIRSTQSWAYTSGAYSQNACSISINGNKKNFTNTSAINAHQKKTLGSHTVVVNHNGDGNKRFNIGATHWWSIYYNVFSPQTLSVSKDWDLDKIPRNSKISINKNNVAYGETVRITITPAGSGLTHNLKYGWGKDNGVIQNNAPNSKDWVVPNSFMNQIPNATSSWGQIVLETYSGGTKLGETKVRLDTYVPGNIIPTFSSKTLSDTNAQVNALVGADKYVQGKSNIRVVINGASGTYTSSIKEYQVVVNGITYRSNNSTVNIGTFSFQGSVKFDVNVLDSRNRKSSIQSQTLSFMPYTSPSIEPNVWRTENGSGKNVQFLRVVYANLLGNKNITTTSFSWRVLGDKNWTKSNQFPTTLSTDTQVINNTTTSNEFDTDKSYEFLGIITDKFESYTSISTISGATATLALGKTGIGIGKMHQRGAMDVAGESYINGNIHLYNGTLYLDDKPVLRRGSFEDVELDSLGRDIMLGGQNTRYISVMKPIDVFELMDIWKQVRIRKGGSLKFFGPDNDRGIIFNDYGNIQFVNAEKTNYWSVKDQGGQDIFVMSSHGATVLNGKTSALRLNHDETGQYMACARVWDRTYSNAPNVYVTDWGTFGRSTSASKYKLNISPVPNYHYKDILKMEPKTWFDKVVVEGNASFLEEKMKLDEKLEAKDITKGMYNYDLSELNKKYIDLQKLEPIYGLIAEELEEAGFVEYCSYSRNENGEREIEGIAYDRLVVPLIEMVKELNQRLEVLEKEKAPL